RRQGLDLGTVEDRPEPEVGARLLARHSASGLPLLDVGLAGRHRHPDPNRVLAAAHAVAELQPRLEAGDPSRVGPWLGGEGLVGGGVLVGVRAAPTPLLPAVARASRLDGFARLLAVALPPRLAFGVREPGLGHGTLLSSGSRPVRDRSPPVAHAKRA